MERAGGYAKRWLAVDPLDEAAYRALMRLYAGSGQQTSALRQYEACERVLMDELAVVPSEETRDLYAAIKERRVGQPYHRPPLILARRQVQCPNCSAENSEGARYCMKCGARLALLCPECGTELPPDPRPDPVSPAARRWWLHRLQTHPTASRNDWTASCPGSSPSA